MCSRSRVVLSSNFITFFSNWNQRATHEKTNKNKDENVKSNNCKSVETGERAFSFSRVLARLSVCVCFKSFEKHFSPLRSHFDECAAIKCIFSMNIKWRQFSTHGMSAIKFRFNWIWTLMFDGYVWETTYFSFGFNRSNCSILYWSSGNHRRLHITTCLCEVIRLLFSICAHNSYSIAHRQQLIQLKIPILGSLVSSTGNNLICDQNRLAHRLEWKWNNKNEKCCR